MKAYQVVAALLLASTAIGGAYASDWAAKPEPAAIVAAEKAADKDVGKLSADGAQAFQDMHAARLAIFNADPKDAKTLDCQGRDGHRQGQDRRFCVPEGREQARREAEPDRGKDQGRGEDGDR